MDAAAPSAATIAAVLTIAAFSTALAYVVYFRILAGAGATNVLLVTLLVPATSVILGAFFLHERLAGRPLLGFALIALGLAFIDGRLPRALARKFDNPTAGSRDSHSPGPEIALASTQERGRRWPSRPREPVDVAAAGRAASR